MAEESKGKPQAWTEWQLRYLLRNAGRIPADTLCENLERDTAEVERVTARLRTLGYPVSLTLAICPTCGEMAPLKQWSGICDACNQQRLYRRTLNKSAEVFRRLTPKDRATYEDCDAETGGRKFDSLPLPTLVCSDADVVERMRAEDAALTARAEWRAKRIERKRRAAQKRKERMMKKVRAYSLPTD